MKHAHLYFKVGVAVVCAALFIFFNKKAEVSTAPVLSSARPEFPHFIFLSNEIPPNVASGARQVAGIVGAMRSTDKNENKDVAAPAPRDPFLKSQEFEVSQSIAGASTSSLDASIIFVKNMDTGKVLIEKNKESRWPLASLTKLMSAVVAVRDLKLDDIITVPPDAFFLSKENMGSVALHVGDRFTLRDILYMMLLPSSNAAADALAASYGRVQFVKEMNAQAVLWDMKETNFEEPTGLSISNQSDAEDVAELASRVLGAYPEIFRITKEVSHTVVELNSGTKIALKNINVFAPRPDFLGGKTGFIDEARQNLLSLFLEGNKRFVFVVMGSTNRFVETEKLLTRITKPTQ